MNRSRIQIPGRVRPDKFHKVNFKSPVKCLGMKIVYGMFLIYTMLTLENVLTLVMQDPTIFCASSIVFGMFTEVSFLLTYYMNLYYPLYQIQFCLKAAGFSLPENYREIVFNEDMDFMDVE